MSGHLRPGAVVPAGDPFAPLQLLRAVESVARLGSAARAAEELHRSASAVSRAVVQAERLLGLPLFDRAARGMHANAAAQVIAARVRRALQALRHGGGETLAARATEAMLHTLVTVAQAGSEGAAAQRIGVSQPAVHQSLRQLEHAARLRLLQRSRRGTHVTEAGERVLRAAKLALAELRTGHDELAALRGLASGRVALGALPMTSDVFVPQALARVLAAGAGFTITVVDGTYEALLQQLRDGELDFVVGPLRGSQAPSDITEEQLFVDVLRPVVRAAHPLRSPARGRRARAPHSLRALAGWPWVGPLPGTPARAAFERAFSSAGMPVPAVTLLANSPALVRSVLLLTDHVALLSELQVRAEVASGLLAVLPLAVQDTQRGIGVMCRRDSLPSTAVSVVLVALRSVAAEIAAAS